LQGLRGLQPYRPLRCQQLQARQGARHGRAQAVVDHHAIDAVRHGTQLARGRIVGLLAVDDIHLAIGRGIQGVVLQGLQHTGGLGRGQGGDLRDGNDAGFRVVAGQRFQQIRRDGGLRHG
jgi:hypothetical protein